MDQVHIVKFTGVRSTLFSVHALDQPASFVCTVLLSIFRRKAGPALGKMCSADVVVSQLQRFTFLQTNQRTS